MPRGERRYKSRAEREVYKAAYGQAYWGRRNMERFEAGQPEFLDQLQRHMAKGMEADRQAQIAGVTEERLDCIHARALFDALLQISREGGIPYIEYFVTVAQAPTGIPGEYDIASFPGDAPEALQTGKTFTTFQLTEHQALVNCYFAPPMDIQEAMLVVMSLIHEGQLGNYGQVVEQD